MLAPGLAIALAVHSLPLPGSTLDVELATAQSSYVMAAKYVGPGRPEATSKAFACSLWSRLEPVEFLKGSLSTDDLNRLPLSMKTEGDERFPEVGRTYLFFVGRSVTKVLHDTPANRAAIAAAPKSREAYDQRHGRPAWSGGIGGGMAPPRVSGSMTRATFPQTMMPRWIGDSPWPEPVPPTPPPIVRERGVRIQPRPDANAAERDFARLFETQDPRPAERTRHFAWLEANEVYRRYTVANKGWSATFQAVRPHPTRANTWLVTISLHPWLYSTQLITLLSDTVEETYELRDGRIRLIESNAATPRPQHQVFPVAM